MNFALNEHFAANQKAGMDSAIAFAGLVFAGFERFAPLNLNAARDVLEESAGAAKQMVAAKTPQEMASLQSTLAQPAVDRLMAYARSSYDIATSNQRAIAKHFESQMADMNKTLSSTLDGVGSNAPAGSEVAVAAFKSLMGAANLAYDSLNKATLHATELAETNIKAAADLGKKATAR